MKDEDVICYCDNTTVLGALVRGSSSAADLNDIIGTIWETVASINCRVWWEYVPSQLNVADPLSRGCTALATSLGGEQVACQPLVIQEGL